MVKINTYINIEKVPGVPQRRTCCCGRGDVCKRLTKRFFALNDQRGRFVQAPNAYASTRHHNRQNIVRQLLERLKQHHLPGLEGFEAYDNRAIIQVRKKEEVLLFGDHEHQHQQLQQQQQQQQQQENHFNETEYNIKNHHTDQTNNAGLNGNQNGTTFGDINYINSVDKTDYDLNNRQNGANNNNNNNSKQGKQKRAIAFIALHHFHPYLIHSFFNKPTAKVPTRHFNFRLTIPKKELNENIPDHGLTEEDEVAGMDSYLCIPNYPIAAAERDAMQQELVASLISPKSTAPEGEGVIKQQNKGEEEHPNAVTNGKDSQIHTHGNNNNNNSNKRRHVDIDWSPEDREREAQRIRENPEDVAQEIHVLRSALVSAVTSQTAQERVDMDDIKIETAISAKFQVLTSDQGGYNRLGFLSIDWHACHPRDAKLLWGFDTWVETKGAIEGHFHLEAPEPTMKLLTRKLELFERCLIARTFVWLGVSLEIIASWWGVPRHTVCRCIKEWAPRWQSLQVQTQQQATTTTTTTTPGNPTGMILAQPMVTAVTMTTHPHESTHNNHNHTNLPKYGNQSRIAEREGP